MTDRSMPCIHNEGGTCYLRQCWLRGCLYARGKRLTQGTGKLPGDRMCQGPGSGFCEYLRPCVGPCRKLELAKDDAPTMEDKIIKTWLDYGYAGMPSP